MVLPAPLVEGAVVEGHPAVQEGVVVEGAGHLQGVGVEGVLREGEEHLAEAVEEINMLKICTQPSQSSKCTYVIFVVHSAIHVRNKYSLTLAIHIHLYMSTVNVQILFHFVSP